MSRLITFLVLSILPFLASGSTVPRSVQFFIDHEVVPDVLASPPASLLSVAFPSGLQALEGDVVPLSEVAEVPELVWDADPERLYTVIFCDADAPSREEPEARSFLHWLVVNVPGDDVTAGETLATFIHSQPEPGTGLHRYIFLVYEQLESIDLEEDANESHDLRRNFAPEDFSKTYQLGTPVAGNFYQTQNLED